MMTVPIADRSDGDEWKNRSNTVAYTISTRTGVRRRLSRRCRVRAGTSLSVDCHGPAPSGLALQPHRQQDLLCRRISAVSSRIGRGRFTCPPKPAIPMKSSISTQSARTGMTNGMRIVIILGMPMPVSLL